MAKTVKELKDVLNKFPDDMEIRLLLSWYDRNNYDYATSDISWSSNGKGIEVDVYEDCGCCMLSNEHTKDIYIYET